MNKVYIVVGVSDLITYNEGVFLHKEMAQVEAARLNVSGNFTYSVEEHLVDDATPSMWDNERPSGAV